MEWRGHCGVESSGVVWRGSFISHGEVEGVMVNWRLRGHSKVEGVIVKWRGSLWSGWGVNMVWRGHGRVEGVVVDCMEGGKNRRNKLRGF